MRSKFPAEILIPLVSVYLIWKQESPQDDFNWAANFPGERVVSTLSEPFHREFYRESKRKLIKANFVSS